MSRVTNGQRPFAETLPAPFQSGNTGCRGDTPTNLIRRNGAHSAFVQHIQCGKGRQDIFPLIDSLQIALEGKALAGRPFFDLEPTAQTYGFAPYYPIHLIGKPNRGPLRTGLLDEDRRRLGLCLSDNDGAIGLDDPRLLPGNFFQCIAEKLHVVVPDIGNHTHHRSDDIRRIEPTSHTHLNHRDLHTVSGKTVERNGCCNLEKRRLNPVDRLAIPFYELDDLLLADLLSIDPDPLTKILQMGRRKESRSVSGRHQRRSNHVRHGPLPIGSRHMDRLDLPVRITQHCLQCIYPLETGFVGTASDVLKNRKRVKQKVERLLISHLSFLIKNQSTIWLRRLMR